MNDIEKNNQSFEIIKHINENGIEFWYNTCYNNIM